MGALRDAESELKPSRSGKLANLFSSIVNTDEAKEQVLASVKLANFNIEAQQSVNQLRNIINANLSVLEQDLLRQKVGIGLVEPKFESIAASCRAKAHRFQIGRSSAFVRETEVISIVVRCDAL